MFDPSPELPDHISLHLVRIASRAKKILLYNGMATLGDVRSASDERLMTLSGNGPKAVKMLRSGIGRRILAAQRGGAVGNQASL